MPFPSIVISSGHGLHVRGAAGILDEVDEARRVVKKVVALLRERGVDVQEFHDDVSTTQNENLNRIVDFHNDQGAHDLDVSVHFNAYEQVSKPMGVEVLYISQGELAEDVSAAIAACGLTPDRGPKKRTDLFFLNNTNEPAILIETCFVDSEADAETYERNFNAICEAIAAVLGGPADAEERPPVEPRPPGTRPPETLPQTARVDIEISGPVILTVNGVTIEP